MPSELLFNALRELHLPHGQYALFGSAPICIRRLRECSHDIDIIVSAFLWDTYSQKSEWEKGTSRLGSPRLFSGPFEMFRDWKPGVWDIDSLILEADVIDGLPFVRLEHVAQWKKLYLNTGIPPESRQKYIRDIKLIEDYFKRRGDGTA